MFWDVLSRLHARPVCADDGMHSMGNRACAAGRWKSRCIAVGGRTAETSRIGWAERDDESESTRADPLSRYRCSVSDSMTVLPPGELVGKPVSFLYILLRRYYMFFHESRYATSSVARPGSRVYLTRYDVKYYTEFPDVL